MTLGSAVGSFMNSVLPVCLSLCILKWFYMKNKWTKIYDNASEYKEDNFSKLYDWLAFTHSCLNIPLLSNKILNASKYVRLNLLIFWKHSIKTSDNARQFLRLGFYFTGVKNNHFYV